MLKMLYKTVPGCIRIPYLPLRVVPYPPLRVVFVPLTGGLPDPAGLQSLEQDLGAVLDLPQSLAQVSQAAAVVCVGGGDMTRAVLYR